MYICIYIKREYSFDLTSKIPCARRDLTPIQYTIQPDLCTCICKKKPRQFSIGAKHTQQDNLICLCFIDFIQSLSFVWVILSTKRDPIQNEHPLWCCKDLSLLSSFVSLLYTDCKKSCWCLVLSFRSFLVLPRGTMSKNSLWGYLGSPHSQVSRPISPFCALQCLISHGSWGAEMAHTILDFVFYS